MAKKRRKPISIIVWAAVLLTPLIILAIPPNDYQPQNLPVQNLPLSLPQASLLPQSQGLSLPSTTARNIFIIDRDSGVVMYAKDANLQEAPASTTKMMTALIVLDHYPLNQIITVTRAYPIGENVGFQPGEKITVEQLLYAMLVQSGNDAAEILAENFPGGRQAFVAAMNQKAQELHLDQTHFMNPTGIDEDGHYSTAVDLARLGDFAMRNAEFARIVNTQNAVVSSVDYSTSHILNNVNALLGHVEGVIGIKTGYTEKAGQSLVTLVDRQNHPVIIVVLGSQDRFADTTVLIDWVYKNFSWVDVNPH